MAKISGWEKFRKAVTGSYSERLTLAIAQENAAKKAAAIAVERAKVSAGTGKVASLKEATRDGDGDGYINDGKPNQRKAPAKKPAAKKSTTTTTKPAAKKPAAKKPASTKKTSK